MDDSNGRVVFRGECGAPIHNTDTNEDLRIADFTSVTRPGAYHIDAAGVGRSRSFRIGADVYNSAFHDAIQAMYLGRCGDAVQTVHNATRYSHAACHLEDAWLDYAGPGHVKKDGTGGWHDAGDYNKYAVNAGVTVGTMLLAWEQFEDQIRGVNLDFEPGKREVPAYLREIQWEMNWVLKMQAPDGSVYHKVSTKAFTPAGAPEKEHEPRYFTPWSSAATAYFVAIAAMSARVYLPYDRAFADRCLEAARTGYRFLLQHPESHLADLKGFTTGAYQTADADDRLWAEAELWETTGDEVVLADFQTRARAFASKIGADWGWRNVKNLAMITYLFSKRGGRDQSLVAQIGDSLISVANGIVRTARSHGYARPLGSRYYWGCNGGVANTTVILQSANRMRRDPDYAEASLDALGHLFGRNYFGRSMVTGVGTDPPRHPHDRRSMGTPNTPAWPGYLVGGPWRNAKDWEDVSARYQMNEIAINWNAGLIYALSGFVSGKSRLTQVVSARVRKPIFPMERSSIVKPERLLIALFCAAGFALVCLCQTSGLASGPVNLKTSPASRPAVSQKQESDKDKLVFADFETIKDNHVVSNQGGSIQLEGYQENPTLKSRFSGQPGADPPTPETVHLKQGDPNRAITFKYELLAPNAYAGAGVEIQSAEAKDGKAVALDVSGYKYLELQLYATGIDAGRVDFNSRDNGVTVTPGGPPQEQFKISPGFNTYRLELKSLSQPNWVPERVNIKDVLKKLTSLTIWVDCVNCSPRSGQVVIDNVLFAK